MTSLLHYTGSSLDRADHLRRDENKLSRLWGRATTRVFPLFQLNNLVDQRSNNAISKTQEELAQLGIQHSEGTFLGLDGDDAVFAVACTEQQAAVWQDSSTGLEFTELRIAGPTLPVNQAPILAYARGILHWQQQNLHCSICGSTTLICNGGHVKRCTSNECGKQVFPRTDPAVIMLVERVGTDGDRYCLLGRSAAWPKEVYSTLAGFVETGESLEEAVAREVFEESGVTVTNVRYMASQPWPFPQSIMLGFVATATSERITIDPVELAEARWFTDREISAFGNWGDQAPGPKLPRPDSIARFLIDSWVNQAT